jgi:hypothetical protein
LDAWARPARNAPGGVGDVVVVVEGVAGHCGVKMGGRRSWSVGGWGSLNHFWAEKAMGVCQHLVAASGTPRRSALLCTRTG